MSNNRGIALLKKIARKFKAFLFSKDALSFLFFLLLSTAFWFSNIANKVREANITIPLRYESLPNNFSITNRPPQEIKLSIKDEGLNLFSYSKKRLVPLNIDLSGVDANKEGAVKLSSEQILSRLSYYLYPTTSVIGFSPDSIYVRYEKMDAVTLPVKLNLNMELAQQYILGDSIVVMPREVTLYGNKSRLSRIKQVETEQIDLTQVKDSVSMSVGLLPVDSVNFSTDKVQVDIAVEMFTEKRSQIPVTFINAPAGISIRSFPAFVDATYNIGLSHYNTKYDDLRVVLDYNDIKGGNQEKQKLKIINYSSKIFNIRIQPEEVEFLLEEHM